MPYPAPPHVAAPSPTWPQSILQTYTSDGWYPQAVQTPLAVSDHSGSSWNLGCQPLGPVLYMASPHQIYDHAMYPYANVPDFTGPPPVNHQPWYQQHASAPMQVGGAPRLYSVGTS